MAVTSSGSAWDRTIYHLPIESMCYTQIAPGSGDELVDALQIVCQHEGESITLHVANTSYDLSNPAVQVMSFLGLRPSTIDDVDIDSGKAMPVYRGENGEYWPAHDIIKQSTVDAADAVAFFSY